MSEIESIDGEIEIICGQTRLFAVKNASRRGGTVIAARRTSSVGVRLRCGSYLRQNRRESFDLPAAMLEDDTLQWHAIQRRQIGFGEDVGRMSHKILSFALRCVADSIC